MEEYDDNRITRDRDLLKLFDTKKQEVIAKFGDKMAMLYEDTWQSIDKPSAKRANKEAFLELPIDESILYPVLMYKLSQLNSNCGDSTSTSYAKAWNILQKNPDKTESLRLKKDLLGLTYEVTPGGDVGIQGIPFFDKEGYILSNHSIHPSILHHYLSLEETDKSSFKYFFENMRKNIVRTFKNHELGEKQGNMSALKKFNITDEYKNDYLLIPKTHAIRNVSPEKLKDFLMTVDNVRALEERVGYNTEFLVELLNIKMVSGKPTNPDVQYSHILLADKEQDDSKVTVWEISKKQINAENELKSLLSKYEFTSHIKKVDPREPVLIYGFLKEKPTTVKNTATTEKKVIEAVS